MSRYITDDEDDDELLADGESVRVRLDMMDGISDPFTHNGGFVLDAVQQSIADAGRKAKAKAKEEEEDMDDNDFEDGATILHDGTGNLAGHRPGFVFSSDSDDPNSKSNWNKQRLNDEYKAEVSNRYKGGLQAGDQLTLCGHSLTVTERKPNGNLMVRDTSTFDADTAKHNAYDAYDSGIQDAYKKKRKPACEEEGEESECKQRDPSESEWQMAGPLSDGRQNTKDAAYAEYEQELANRWKK